MFGRSYRIATLRGIPVQVDASWIWIAVLVTYSLWLRFADAGARVSTAVALGYAVLTAVLFFGGVFLHEAAHAFAARVQGIEVFGITLVVFGGFTSTRSDQRGPGPAFLIAAAGPAASLALGALAWTAGRALASPMPLLGDALEYVGWVNVLMAAFNVLPGLPLDGGRMLETAVWKLGGSRERGTRVAALSGMAVGGLLLAGGAWEASRGEIVGAIWFGVIGMFIFQGARSARDGARSAATLRGATVRDAMSPPPSSIAASLSLSDALDRHLRGRGEQAFPVVEDGVVIGMVSLTSASPVGAQDPLRPVRDATVPISEFLVVAPEDALDGVAMQLASRGAALVISGGMAVGVITGGDVVRWIEARDGSHGGVTGQG